MKKLIAMILTLALVVAMGTTTAFAATVEENGGEASIDVKAKYSSSATTPTKYSVDVEWGAMEFTYSVGGVHEWDPETHTYTDKTDAIWTATGNTVTVTNHSNVAITAALSFKAVDGYNVTGTFSNATISLPSAVDKATDAAELTGTSALTLDGTLADTVTALTKVGTITVKIS